MGDFNLNLLTYETHADPNDFLNSMISYSLLPYIMHPTRVTDYSSTVIDNIFSNITDCESKGSNVLCEISDHFPQFIIIEKSIVDYKACSFAKRDFSKVNENSFVQDYLSSDQVYAVHSITMIQTLTRCSIHFTKICPIQSINMCLQEK